MRRSIVLTLATVLLAWGCGIHFGHVFPSPDPAQITVNVTDKVQLQRTFGEPYQVGLDSGDQTWRWFYGERGASTEVTKDFTVRFNANGTVKSYSFTSNFPEDMSTFKK